MNARSARGLSFSAYVLETLAYAITLAYSFRNGFPFSTYGENFFLTIQNVAITLLILAYSPRPADKTANLTIASLGGAATFFALFAVPENILSLLQLSTLPLSLFSKLPQIRQNYRSQSTGQLSVFAVASQVAGCLARLFTTSQELGDSIVAAGFALALVLNVILALQLWQYWGQDETVNDEFGLGSRAAEKRRASPGYEPASWESPPRVATPPLQSGNRKWARKVD